MSTPQTMAAARQIQRWRRNPVEFVRKEFRVEPDEFQIDLLTAFADPTIQRIAERACKGPGKTAGLAWCAWNFLGTRPHPKIAATSISLANLQDNLWTEMAKWQAKSEYLKRMFVWTKSRIFAKDHPETWWMSARSWSQSADKEQQANTLAGLHADYIALLVDESGDVPDAVMAAGDAVLSSAIEGKILQAGNPTQLSGPLYRACTVERHLWHLINITGDPDNPKRSTRVSEKWAREQIEKYGRDNPWVLVNVFGEFPPTALNILLGPDQVQAAMARHLREEQYAHAAKIIGVDPGRFGGDRSVIFPRQGLAGLTPVIMRPDRSTKDWTGILAGRIAQGFDKWKADMIFVDDTGGWGGGVIDRLDAAGYPVIPVNFSGKAMDPRYKNRRAEMHFLAAECVMQGAALPNLPELQREATASCYWFRDNKFQVEEKEQVKVKLNGESPDLWDAYCLTFASPVAPKTGLPHLDAQMHQVRTEPQQETYGAGVGRVLVG